MQPFKTADLSDDHPTATQACATQFMWYGKKKSFCGEIVTLQVLEDAGLLRHHLQQPGHGKVAVVDGGGSLRTALLGDKMATMASRNAWEGIVILGAIRDSAELQQMDIGVMALGTHPSRSTMLQTGEQGIAVTFGGATFVQGQYIYCDQDGILTSKDKLV